MINLAQAQSIAEEYIKSIENKEKYKLLLLLEETIEFEFGWVFFYQSKEYIFTQNIMEALGGNAPIIVNKFDESIEVMGTGEPIQFYIDKYIKKHTT